MSDGAPKDHGGAGCRPVDAGHPGAGGAADPEVLTEFQGQADSALAMGMSDLEPVRKEVVHRVCDKPAFRRWFDQRENAEPRSQELAPVRIKGFLGNGVVRVPLVCLMGEVVKEVSNRNGLWLRKQAIVLQLPVAELPIPKAKVVDGGVPSGRVTGIVVLQRPDHESGDVVPEPFGIEERKGVAQVLDSRVRDVLPASVCVALPGFRLLLLVSVVVQRPGLVESDAIAALHVPEGAFDLRNQCSSDSRVALFGVHRTTSRKVRPYAVRIRHARTPRRAQEKDTRQHS